MQLIVNWFLWRNKQFCYVLKLFFISLIYFFGREFGRPNRYTDIKNPLDTALQTIVQTQKKTMEQWKINSNIQPLHCMIQIASNNLTKRLHQAWKNRAKSKANIGFMHLQFDPLAPSLLLYHSPPTNMVGNVLFPDWVSRKTMTLLSHRTVWHFPRCLESQLVHNYEKIFSVWRESYFGK